MRRPRWSPDHDMQALCVEAAAAGWRLSRTGGDHIRMVSPTGDHIRMVSPTGGLVFAGSTPSDTRAVHNTRGEMRRVWPGWDGSEKREPRRRGKRPGRAPVWRGAYQWDGRPGTEDQPLGATLGDLWPR